MATDAGTEQAPEASGVEPQGQAEQTGDTPAGGSNPNWDELRSEVGDTTFHLLQPHLTKWDKAAQDRISRANAEAKRYSELGDFDTLSTYRSVATQLDEDPTGFYERLGEELRRRGMLEAAQAVEDAGDEGEDPEDEGDDPRLSAVEQALQQIAEREQQQAEQAQVLSWQNEWDSAFDQAKASAPWLTDEDDEVLRALAGPLFNDTDDVSVTFQKALSSLNNLRNRTLSAPRAGDSAPRLIPTGGGNPAAAQQQDVSKLGRRETVDLVAGMLRAQQQ